jgi:hypothetical protein
VPAPGRGVICFGENAWASVAGLMAGRASSAIGLPGRRASIMRGMVIEAQSFGVRSIRVREASRCVMYSQLHVKRQTCGGATATRIKVESLRCGHCGALDETDLPRFGIDSGAPIATFVKRLTCAHAGAIACVRSDPIVRTRCP